MEKRPPEIPLYRVVANGVLKLRRESAGGILESERKLGERFGVNRVTVRRGLQELEKEGKLVRIPGKGWKFVENCLPDLVPNVPNVPSKSGLPVVGYPFWVPSFADLELENNVGRFKTIRALRDELRSLGYALDVQCVGMVEHPNLELIQELKSRWVGYITEPTGRFEMLENDPFRDMEDRRVVIGYMNKQLTNCVCADFHQLSELAIDHLAACGARRILMLTGSTDLTSQYLLKVAGVEKAISRYPGVEAIIEDVGGGYRPHGYSAIRRLIAEGVAFDALICASSYVAQGALRALMDHHIRVPEQVQVVGSGYSPYSMPRLTAGYLDIQVLGRMAAQMLHLILKNGKPIPNQIFPGVLIEGETTLPKRGTARGEAGRSSSVSYEEGSSVPCPSVPGLYP